MNAVKSTSGKQGDLYMKESKSTTGIYDSLVPRPPPFFEHAHETGHYRIYSNKRRGAYLIVRGSCAALIRGRRLLKGSYHKAKTFPCCNSYREEKEGGWACRTGEVYSLHARTEEREHFEERTE